MKIARLFAAAVLAVSMCGAVSFAEEKAADKADKKFTEGSCCDKAQKAGKECSHPCCADASKEGKVCTKCNKPEKKDAK